jgi:hypothetical protein
MKRLLQFGTMILLISIFAPGLELFDHWDPPGLSNDTEYGVFAFVVILCLVLLVGKLIASEALRFIFTSIRSLLPHDKTRSIEAGHTLIFAVPPLIERPLRI